MNPLPLDKALELYSLLKDYLPDKVDSIIELSDIIMNSIVEKEGFDNYVKSLSLMSGIPEKILAMRDKNERVSLFMEGLLVNEVMELKVFCESLGM